MNVIEHTILGVFVTFVIVLAFTLTLSGLLVLAVPVAALGILISIRLFNRFLENAEWRKLNDQ